jgi:hypothetical protein
MCIIKNNAITIIIMEDSKTLILLFKFPIVTQEDFFEIYRQFGPKKFRQPCSRGTANFLVITLFRMCLRSPVYPMINTGTRDFVHYAAYC